MGKTEEYALVIAYKYDMAKLIRKNGRATMMAIMLSHTRLRKSITGGTSDGNRTYNNTGNVCTWRQT